MAIFRTHKKVWIVDSCGGKAAFLKRNFKKVKGLQTVVFNPQELQPRESILCGGFCLRFAFYALWNWKLTFRQILNYAYDMNLSHNEASVNEFLNELSNGSDH